MSAEEEEESTFHPVCVIVRVEIAAALAVAIVVQVVVADLTVVAILVGVVMKGVQAAIVVSEVAVIAEEEVGLTIAEVVLEAMAVEEIVVLETVASETETGLTVPKIAIALVVSMIVIDLNNSNSQVVAPTVAGVEWKRIKKYTTNLDSHFLLSDSILQVNYGNIQNESIKKMFPN